MLLGTKAEFIVSPAAVKFSRQELKLEISETSLVSRESERIFPTVEKSN